MEREGYIKGIERECLLESGMFPTLLRCPRTAARYLVVRFCTEGAAEGSRLMLEAFLGRLGPLPGFCSLGCQGLDPCCSSASVAILPIV